MKDQIKKVILFVLLALPMISFAQVEVTFTNHTVLENFDDAAFSIAIDLDGDDDIDIVSNAYQGGKIVWLENDGHENFTEHEIITGLDYTWRLKVLDIDHDGDLDVWSSAYTFELNADITVWFENDGSQVFTRHDSMDMFGAATSTPEDFNGDGVIDFIVYENESSPTTTWYEGVIGQDYIAHTVTILPSPNLEYANFPGGDLDFDKDIDYIVKDTITNETFFLENQNGLSFIKNPMVIDFDDNIIIFNDKVDIDSDGDYDLLAISNNLNQVYWYENTGSLNYTKHTIDTANNYAYWISASDINQDGFIDIIVSSYSDNQVVGYFNDGQQVFTKQVLGSVTGALSHYVVDLDDDNDEDVIMNGYVADKVVWLKTKLATPKNQLNLSQDQNYVYSIAPQVAVKNETELNDLTNRKDALETVAYFDGLGRPKQQVAIGQSFSGKDIITHIQYDQFGRQAQDFLPYVSADIANDGSFKTEDQASNISDYYQNNYPEDLIGVINPFSEKLFEASPLNRVLEQAAPGADWSVGNINTNTGQSDGHTIKFDYQTNTLDLNDDSQDNVRLFRVEFVNNNYKPKLINNKPTDYYQAGELYKTIAKDENWTANQSGTKDKNHTTEEFKDKQGRVVLKRTYNANTVNTNIKNAKHDTYYVYDDYGNLTYVIPPRADIKNNQSTRTRALNELCYQYQYDKRNRLIKKKIPGKGWEFIVYDKLDRPILTQDKNLKNKGKWLFTKYDAFGRVVYTGKYTSGQNRIDLQTQADTYTAINLYEDRQGGTVLGDATVNYSHRSFPTAGLKVLTVNYYDDYNFNLDGGTNPIDVLGIPVTTNTKSLATASQVRVLGTDKWINTVSYYDKKARPIYSYSKNNYLNTVDISKTQLDFVGNVQRTVSRHTKGNNPTIKTIDRFRYDHANRLLKQTQQINNKEVEVLAENQYDELGQLIKKGVGNQPLGKRLQDIDYAYNIRGWLKTINDPEQALTDDLFAFKLNYNTISTTAGGTSRLSTEPLYNGNISETIWRTANDNKKRGYGYKYDALNRIKRGRYKAGDYLTQEDRFFDIKGIKYDKNGNIKNLNRFSPDAAFNTRVKTDELTYKYFQLSNKLKSVTDASGSDKGFKDGNTSNDDYTYDQNGNLKNDKNKGITNIKYNHLNLPTLINFGGGNKIQYFYDATGLKLKKKVTDNGTILMTDYMANGAVYENDALQFIPTAEGYVTKSGNSWSYVYQYKDHLGNIRLSYSDSDGDGTISQSEIVEENNYYPFGLEHKGYNFNISANGNSTAQKYKYNGKELENFLGLNLYEMDFRQYDPAIGRFTAVDEMSEEAFSLSPFRFGFNNPIVFSDPTGLWEVINGGYSTTDKDEIERLLGYVNRTNSDTSTKGLMNFIKEDIKFMDEARSNNQLSSVNVKYGGRISNRGILRMKNEIAFHQGRTSYIYDNNDIRIRNNLNRDRRGKFYANLINRWENRGQFKPLSASNYIDWEAGGDERVARLKVYNEFRTMIDIVDGGGSSISSLQAMAKRGRTTSNILKTKGLSVRSIPKNISWKQYHQKYSFLYRGKYKGQGTYVKAMAKDWRAITGK